MREFGVVAVMMMMMMILKALFQTVIVLDIVCWLNLGQQLCGSQNSGAGISARAKSVCSCVFIFVYFNLCIYVFLYFYLCICVFLYFYICIYVFLFEH